MRITFANAMFLANNTSFGYRRLHQTTDNFKSALTVIQDMPASSLSDTKAKFNNVLPKHCVSFILAAVIKSNLGID